MLKAYLYLTLAMVIVGSSIVAGKVMVDSLPIFFSSALRFLLAAMLLIPILLFREGGIPRLSFRSWVLLALQALCGSFLFTVFLLYGLKFISPATAGIITSTTPAFMGLIGWIVFRERILPMTAAGILFSVLGVLFLNSGRPDSYNSESFIGVALVLGAVLVESLFLVLGKLVKDTISPLASTAIISFFGLIWFLPAGTYEYLSNDFTAVSASAWLVVVYYGLVVTVLAYLFWFAGIANVQASVAGIFTGIMPLTSLWLSFVLLGENLDWGHYTGAAAVVLGIAMISGADFNLFKRIWFWRKCEEL